MSRLPGKASSSRRSWPRTAAALALGGALACAPGAGSRVDSAATDVLRHNEAALEELRFGMSREEAARVMGAADLTPPWANPHGIGPQVVANPFDRFEVESQSGDVYDVHRYAVGFWGRPECPLVRGEVRLVPLIFLGDGLVGWRWSYLESALARPLSAEERGFRFGGFCDGRAATGSAE